MREKGTATPKIIHVTNRKNGVTYLYEDHAFWNKEKKRGEHKRTCIGKIGPDGKEQFNERYRSRTKDDGSSPVVSKAILMGQNLILHKVVSHTGILPHLKAVFGEEDAGKIISLAKYSVCEGKALSRAQDWLDARGMDGSSLCPQRISELLESISEDKRNAFFRSWLSREAVGKRALLFDITSISSYAKGNPFVERGYNRDHERLPQINLGLLSSHTANTPLWYTQLPGSMSDCAVLSFVLDSLEKLGVKDIELVGDRGFYSERNIRSIVSRGQRFTIPVPSRISWQKELVDKVKGDLRMPGNIIRTPGEDKSFIYGVTDYRTESWGRSWRHVYFDPARREGDIDSLMLLLRQCEQELSDDRPVESHQDIYRTYFTVKETPKRGRKVILDRAAVDAYANGYSGYWVLLSNACKDASEALDHYRRRGDIELQFDDMKNLLDCGRLRVHSGATMQGRLFVNFVTLVILAEYRREVSAIPPKDRHWWDGGDMLAKSATYARIHFTGRYKDVWTVPTKAQRTIFDLLGVSYSWKGKNVNEPEPDEPEWAENNPVIPT
jgi:hypothetical protein